MAEPRLDVKIVGKGRDLVLINALLTDRTSYGALADRIGGPAPADHRQSAGLRRLACTADSA